MLTALRVHNNAKRTSPPSKLYLESLEVSLVLDDFDERLKEVTNTDSGQQSRQQARQAS
jgi:hypothetical protein